ncbi:MAG: IS630 family transposase [Gammaproteobacteria bacterium]
MAFSVLEMSRPVRRRLQRVVKKSRNVDHVRRAQGLLRLHAVGGNVSAAAQMCGASRRALRQWRALYEAGGERAIAPKPRGREDWKATTALLQQLSALVRTDPTGLGDLRSRWSSELLALELKRRGAVEVHATTIRRWLAGLGIVWRRARPTLHIADARKQQKMRAIRSALRRASALEEVFYVDEADIDLNPRIGASWTPRGQQPTVPTPGKNRKCYVAGALNARTGRVIWVEHTHKNTELFLRLLQALLRSYRRARRLQLIVDNYVIHRSRMLASWLARHRRVRLLFQPAYHPWVNRIERLWKQLHDTVTRNHRHRDLSKLMTAVRRFMRVCQPFPGNAPALATAS